MDNTVEKFTISAKEIESFKNDLIELKFNCQRNRGLAILRSDCTDDKDYYTNSHRREKDEEEYNNEEDFYFDEIEYWFPPPNENSFNLDYSRNTNALLDHIKIADYCDRIVKYYPLYGFGLLTEHKYTTNVGRRFLAGIDRAIVKKILAKNKTLRCFCIPIILCVAPDRYIVELKVGKEFEKLLTGIEIVHHYPFAHSFTTTIYQIDREYEGAKFLYSASATVFVYNAPKGFEEVEFEKGWFHPETN